MSDTTVDAEVEAPEPEPEPGMPVTINGQRGAGPRGRAGHRRGRAPRRLHPPLLLPPADEPGRHVPHVHRRDRHRPRPGAAAELHDRVHPGHEGRHDLRGHHEGPGRRARVPARQPPARLPGVRQGRRVPAAGPDHGLRPGREPLRRGEAAQGEADPDQRPGAARPRALHPLRPLHPVRQGRGRRPADPLHQPGQRHRDQHLPRRAVRVLLQRQHRADLPGRRAHGDELPLQGPPVGPPGHRVDLPGLLGRLPRRRSSRRATRCCATRASTSTRSTGAGCATRAASASRPSTATTAWPIRSCATATTSSAPGGSTRSVGPPTRCGPRLRARPGARSRCSAAPGSPTRPPTPGPSWPRASSAPTTSTPSSATACRPRSCSACPGPPSTTCARPAAPSSCSAPTSRRSCRSSSCGSATPWSTTAPRSSRSARRPPASAATPRCRCTPARARPAPPSRALLDGTLGRLRRRRGRRRRALARAAELLGAGPVTVVLGRQSLAESADAVVDAARRLLRRPSRHPLPAGAAPGQRQRRPRHGPRPGPAARPGHPRRGPRPLRRLAGSGVPAETGLDAPGILQAAADGRVDVLVLLGADPLADFPDHDLATRALAGARTVIAVDQFPTASVRQADVVLPAAGFAEVEGTTTNIEGRVSVLNQKVTGPGTARADWIIAAELARRLGTDLGPRVGRRHPGRDRRPGAGLRRAHRRAARLAGGPRRHRRAARLRSARRPARAAGRRGLPARGPGHRRGRRADAARPPSRRDRCGGRDRRGRRRRRRRAGAEPSPPLRRWSRSSPVRPLELAPLDTYSLRLVATRKLYDQGTLLAEAPALAKLAPGTILTVNPYDFDRLGVAAGDRVRMQTSRATLTAEIAADAGVPRGLGVGRVQPARPARGRADRRVAAGHRRAGRDGGELTMGDPLLIEPIDDWVGGRRHRHRQGRHRLRAAARSLTMFMIWFERKLVSAMHNRIGPTLAGPWGILQTLADGIKFFFKEDLIPDRAERAVFILAPFLSFVPAFLIFPIVPDRRQLQRRPRRHHHDRSATTPTCSWPTRPSASCSCWPCRRSRSTA